MADPDTVIPATEVVPVDSKKDVFKNKKLVAFTNREPFIETNRQ